MIKILLVKGDGSLQCTASGHALYDKKGRDIVCAAVSVLIRTAARSLQGVSGVEFLEDKPIRGEVSFKASVKDDQDGLKRAQVEWTADFLQKGFEGLAKDFPQNVELDFLEEYYGKK